MRLLRAEVGRLLSRRPVALLLLAGILLTVLLAAGVLWDSRPVGADQLASARAQAATAAADHGLRRELATCHRDPRTFLGPGAHARQCDSELLPHTEDYLPRVPLDVADVRHGRGLVLMLAVAVLAVLAGTTYAGGDWATGSMSQQLLYVPRRSTAWRAKAAAVTLGTAVAAGLLLGGFWLVVSLVAAHRGAPLGDAVALDVRWQVLRGVTLAAAGGLGGFALTMLLRHTVGAVALLFAYAVGGEALVTFLPVDRAGRWSLGSNVMAWLRDGTRVFDDTLGCRSSVRVCDRHYGVSLAHGVTYLGALLAVTVLVSWLSFRRRDLPLR
ncbi:MAG: hypothetical protein ACXVWU_02635 [Nocardioides sp.]